MGERWILIRISNIMAHMAKKIHLPIPLFSEFRDFLFATLKNWIFLLFLFVDLVAITIRFIDPGLSLPQVYYAVFLFAGFAGSAFQVYRNLLLDYRRSTLPVEKKLVSKLSISFVAGNEYAYSISDPYAGQNLYITKMQKTRGTKCRFDGRGVLYINDKVYYVMSKGSLEINLRLENSGDLPLDVLAIRSENDLDLRYLHIVSDGVFLNGNKLRTPFHLKCGEFIILKSRSKIIPGKGSSNGEFAVDFHSLPKSISHEISVDTVDADGKRQTYVEKIETPSKPLMELYERQWREYEQEEYLVLAGYSLTPDI